MSRPNIIFIITDQQRADTIGAWGCDYMTTPHMDRLAREGVSFTNAFCPGATCVASRAAIFTGMYPHNTGVYAFQDWSQHRNWVHDLKEAGYWCANIGKMHLEAQGVDDGFHERIKVENPTNKQRENGGGDDDWGRFLAHHGQERPNNRNFTDPQWLQKYQGVPWHLEERFHSDVFIGDAAVGWIDSWQGDKPLFLEVGFTGPHEPWDPLERHLDMYKDRELPPAVQRQGELDNKPPQHRAHQEAFIHTRGEAQIDLTGASAEDIAEMRRHYYAKITTVDEQLGKVLDALERKGLLENSLLVFCSDHGEMLGDHQMAYKWLMYDSITRIPLVVCDFRAESNRPQGTVDELVSLMDIGPTFLEAAGVEAATYLEGNSLAPYLGRDDTGFAPRDWVFCEDNYQIMMRGKTHKLVYYIGQAEGELYDLAQDPHELDNLWDSPDHQELKTQMRLQLLEWLAASTYWNAGYRQTRNQHYKLRWPGADRALHGPMPEDGGVRTVGL
ncbi:MAG: sulfatase-like hydrolase/transferase [Candidatus Latescibacteria bacterium]|nr:sulfatase-like hydrolase/transferase [Candidatus Latescibacterota bacterium]